MKRPTRRAVLTGRVRTAGISTAGISTAAAAAWAATVERSVAAHHLSVAPRLWAEAELLVQTFADHHVAHAEELARVAGTDATETNPGLDAELAAATTEDRSESDLIRGVLTLESRLAATYLVQLPELDSAPGAGIVAGILAGEADHAARVAHLIGDGLDGALPGGGIEPPDLDRAFDPARYPT